MRETKTWMIGTEKVVTEIGVSGTFIYGCLSIGNLIHSYDLRYTEEADLHAYMIKDCFGDQLISTNAYERRTA